MAQTKRLRTLKTTLAGFLTTGFLTLPGLAAAQQAPQPAQPMQVEAPGPVLKAKAKLDKRGKAKGKHQASAAPPTPVPPPAELQAAGQPAAPAPSPVAPASMAAIPPAAAPTAVTAMAPAVLIPQPPRRPRELLALAATSTAPVDDDTPTSAIPLGAPAALREGAADPYKVQPLGNVDSLITKHAARYNVPESLLRRVVKRESGFNPRARNGPYLGLMQMRLDTARGMGYQGNPAGLFDADTNLTYGAAYLANAWRVSGGSQERAVRLYSSGYYYEAKRRGMLPRLIKGSPSR